MVDYAASLDCIHCGLCLQSCPTYRLDGAETSSPRGRIYLMRGVAEGRLDPASPEYAEELDFCLVCRNCESACPAGVRFGEMMEHARDSLGRQGRGFLERALRRVGFGWFLRSRAGMRLGFGALRLAQRTGLLRLCAPARGRTRSGPASLPRRSAPAGAGPDAAGDARRGRAPGPGGAARGLRHARALRPREPRHSARPGPARRGEPLRPRAHLLWGTARPQRRARTRAAARAGRRSPPSSRWWTTRERRSPWSSTAPVAVPT